MSAHTDTTSTNLHRVKLVKNPNFVHNGKMSYGHALRKCKCNHLPTWRLFTAELVSVGFKPTLDYPFQVVDEVVHSGGMGHRLNEQAHGRQPHVARRHLMACDEHGKVGEVSAQDVQQV
jgi:hypothetical protein